ncbi:MAG: polyprenyl diphosphate synthase [Candidatus Micrarchaeaceae archaeon]
MTTDSYIGKVPGHIALIPDGNRRWARTHKLSFLKGYSLGVKKFIKFSIWAKRLGVKMLTVWALSTENIKNRSKDELSILYRIYVHAAQDKSILKMLKDNKARINIIGNTTLLPANVKNALYELQRKTHNYKEFTINLLIGYGGRDDLMHALKSASRSNEAPSTATFSKYLLTSKIPDVDLVIRTSGEMRLSGFLPWQAGYSELYFAKKYWPDFDRNDLVSAVRDFSERERRFGK